MLTTLEHKFNETKAIETVIFTSTQALTVENASWWMSIDSNFTVRFLVTDVNVLTKITLMPNLLKIIEFYSITS